MDEKVCRQLNLSWVFAQSFLEKNGKYSYSSNVQSMHVRDGLLEKGDVTVITSGVPIGRSGTTNMLKVQVVDD